MKIRTDGIKTFTWKGFNKQGLRVKGTLFGSDLQSIKDELLRQEIVPLLINKSKTDFFTKYTYKQLNQALVCRHLATLISAGVPLVQAIDAIAKSQKSPLLQAIFQAIRNEVASGRMFYIALAQYPRCFSHIMIHLVKIGEISGTLSDILQRLADYLEKTSILKRKISKAFYYPIFISCVSSILLLSFLVFIIPKFELLYASFGGHLPRYTKMIIHLSHKVQTYGLCGAIFFSLLIAAFIFTSKHYPLFKVWRDTKLLCLPILGSLISKFSLALITRALSTILTAGIPIVEALAIVANLTNNQFYSEALNRVKAEIIVGRQMHSAMISTKAFPTMVIQMVTVGEETGNLNFMFDKIAKFYEEDVEITVNGLSTLVEPFIMVILGIIIGGFVLAMYLPIFQLGSIF